MLPTLSRRILWTLTLALFIVFAKPAGASFHLYVINQIYSDSTGNIQYVIITTNTSGENFLVGHAITALQGGNSVAFNFPTVLPGDTANTKVLIATQGFANLGLVKPDYIVPNHFLFLTNGSVNYADVDLVSYAALPTDGIHAINRSGQQVVNSPTNFAGATGTIQPAAATIATLNEFPLPTAASLPTLGARGVDGNLWVTEQTGNKIAQVTPAGIITEFAIPTAAAKPTNITPGPDNALWFTENGSSKIGRITTAGAVTEFTIPTAASTPGDIVTGPDGNLWFTENAGNKVARITPAGSITEFPIPTAASQSRGIITGPDGNLWFIEFNGNKIGRITTSGSIVEFPLPTAGSQPNQIIRGPDGNLWFVELTGNKLGRITTTGVLTEFPVPTAASQPTLMVNGSDGNLWFTEANGNKIGQMTTAGVVTEYVIPTAASHPDRIARGRDGALWFEEDAGNKIGRITYAGVIGEMTDPTAAVGYNALISGNDGNLWYVGQSGNIVGQIVAPGFNAPTLAASVLPSSRSGLVGSTATAFATMINAGTTTAHSCQLIDGIVDSPATFQYQTTTSTNAPIGSVNTPIDVAAGQAQSFIIAFTPTGPFLPVNERIGFHCTDVGSAAFIIGVNTLQLSGSATPVPDVVALASTSGSIPGVVDVPGATGPGFFAVATVNVGSSGTITATADTGSASLPLTLALCQSNPATAACINPTAPAASSTVTIAANATPTFVIYATATGTVAFDPANNRIFVRLTDQSGTIRGSTSVAVRTTSAPRAACQYLIAPTNNSMGYMGGVGTVNVTAPSGCGWTAASNSNWISVTSGTGGSGNGLVSYSANMNALALQASGTLTIAGQTFTLTEDPYMMPPPNPYYGYSTPLPDNLMVLPGR